MVKMMIGEGKRDVRFLTWPRRSTSSSDSGSQPRTRVAYDLTCEA
jgi:hypothetical protein